MPDPSIFCFLLATLALASADEVCQSIIQAASTSSSCQPLGDCSGMSCTSNDRTTTVTVNKCTDPVEVNVTVVDSVNTIVSAIVTGPGAIMDSEYNMETFTRDDFALTISVTDGGSSVTIPTVDIPLNASDCTCQAIMSIDERVESPPGANTECEANSMCTGQECSFTVASQTFFLESDMFPCSNPAGFAFIVRDSSKVAVSDFFFDKNDSVTLLGVFPFNVTVVHREYSIIIQGSLRYSGQWYDIIPETQIILDRTMCVGTLQPSSVSSSTAMPSVTSTPLVPGISPGTCQAMREIRDETNAAKLSQCTLNAGCDTLSCVTFNEFTSSTQVLPCLSPPAIHMIILDNDVPLYNQVITNTTSFPIGPGSFIVHITQLEGGMTVKVDADLGLGALPVIQEKTIPIDTCYCPDVNCATTGSLSSALPSSTSKGQSASSSVVAVAVGVPLAVLLLVIIAAIIVVIGVLVLMKKSKYKKQEDEPNVSVKNIGYDDKEKLSY